MDQAERTTVAMTETSNWYTFIRFFDAFLKQFSKDIVPKNGGLFMVMNPMVGSKTSPEKTKSKYNTGMSMDPG